MRRADRLKVTRTRKPPPDPAAEQVAERKHGRLLLRLLGFWLLHALIGRD